MGTLPSYPLVAAPLQDSDQFYLERGAAADRGKRASVGMLVSKVEATPRPYMSRRPLMLRRKRIGTTYLPTGYSSITPGYPRMQDGGVEVGAIGPGMQKRKITVSGIPDTQDFDDWGAWDASGAAFWVAPSPMSTSTQIVTEYNQWDIGPLTDRIDLNIFMTAVTVDGFSQEPVHIGLRALSGWVGDIIIPVSVHIQITDIPAGSTVETLLNLRLEDADAAQSARYGGHALRIPLTGPSTLTFRALLKLTRSASGALSSGWAREYSAADLAIPV